MKKPDEIKKALEICTGCGGCKNCPYPDDECFGDTVMRDALAYIQQLEAAQPKWISAEDRLPDSDAFNKYLVAFQSSGQFVIDTACYNGEYGWMLSHWIPSDVTHWMPLPLPPSIIEHANNALEDK